MESLCNLWIHFDKELLLLRKFFVTTCNLIIYPGFERRA